MKKYRCLYILIPVIVIILELLPFGAVLNFGVPADEGGIRKIRETYSYFSLVPFGYANFGCLITAVLSCVLLMLGIAYFVKEVKILKKAIAVVSVFSVISSVSPLLYGLEYFSTVGAIISLLLILELILLLIFKNDRNCE